MIFNSSDEESYFEEDAEYGNPRATLLSAVSGIAGIPGLAAPGAYQERSYQIRYANLLFYSRFSPKFLKLDISERNAYAGNIYQFGEQKQKQRLASIVLNF